LRIRTQGSGRDRLEWRSAPVPPGGEGVLTVDLAARAYDLDCPVEDGHGEHDALGMETVFVVRDGAPPLGTPPPARTTAAAGSASTVEISGFAFAPAQLRVRVGARVTWRNLDPAPHTATGDGWDTGRLASGAASTIAFDRPGTFAYVCAVHPAMAATVVVAR
jgi:plastocyanin